MNVKMLSLITKLGNIFFSKIIQFFQIKLSFPVQNFAWILFKINKFREWYFVRLIS